MTKEQLKDETEFKNKTSHIALQQFYVKLTLHQSNRFPCRSNLMISSLLHEAIIKFCFSYDILSNVQRDFSLTVQFRKLRRVFVQEIVCVLGL